MQPTLTQQTARTVWLNVPLTVELRKQLKIEAARREQTSREFVLDAIKAAMRGQNRGIKQPS